MDAQSVLTFMYKTGCELMKRCELVKQCHIESARICVRTNRVLGSLERASSQFSNQAWFQGSMVELQRTLDQANDLVGRCEKPRTMRAKASALMNSNTLRDGLLSLEVDLERIMNDLKIPMQTDIKKAVADIEESITRAAAGIGEKVDDMGAGLDKVLARAVQEGIRLEQNARIEGVLTGDIIQAHRSKLAEAAGRDDASSGAEQTSAGKSGERIDLFHLLGRVRYDMLEEDPGVVLGGGSFGIVVSGRYRGEEVAIKKARGVVGDQRVLTDFR